MDTISFCPLFFSDLPDCDDAFNDWHGKHPGFNDLSKYQCRGEMKLGPWLDT